MSKSGHYDTARLVIGFLAVCLMAGIFFIFYNNDIMQSDQLGLFMMLTVIAGGLLIGLFYLVSNQTHSQKASARKKKKSSR